MMSRSYDRGMRTTLTLDDDDRTLPIRGQFELAPEHGTLVGSTDHFSVPSTTRPPTAASPTTINDVFAFVSPSNSANTVLIFDFQPFPGVLTPSTADPTKTYEIHINNTSPLDGSDNLDFRDVRLKPL